MVRGFFLAAFGFIGEASGVCCLFPAGATISMSFRFPRMSVVEEVEAAPPSTRHASSVFRPYTSLRVLKTSSPAGMTEDESSFMADESSGRGGGAFSGGGVQSILLLIAGSRLTGSLSAGSGGSSGALSVAGTGWAKCLLVVSAFFFARGPFAAGFVTLPFGSVVCAAAVSLVALGFLAAFLGATCAGGTSITESSAAQSCDLRGSTISIPPVPIALELPVVVRAVGTLAGASGALVRRRVGESFGAVGTRSQIEGNSGDEDMTTTESWCAMRGAGDEVKNPREAILAGLLEAVLDLASREKNPMRPARPALAHAALRTVSLGFWQGDGEPLSQVRVGDSRCPLGESRARCC